MPVSASKAARQAKRADDKAKKTPTSSLATSNANSNVNSSANSENGDLQDGDTVNGVTGETAHESQLKSLSLQQDKDGISDRVTTGVLASLPTSRDVKITSASLVFHGKVLFNDTNLEVSYSRRYGLLGENGCGKSTLLKAIDAREFPFPDAVDIYLLNEGAPKTDLGALEWVVTEAENELKRLESLSEKILEDNGPEDPSLQDLYEVSYNTCPYA